MREPVIYGLGWQPKVMIDVGRADINENKRWVVLELEGKGKAIKRGIAGQAAKGQESTLLSEIR